MKHRINSKAERGEILVRLTKRLIEVKCTDLETLTHIDRLCRRTWGDLHCGWISWSYYMGKVLGREHYQAWAQENCRRMDKESAA